MLQNPILHQQTINRILQNKSILYIKLKIPHCQPFLIFPQKSNTAIDLIIGHRS